MFVNIVHKYYWVFDSEFGKLLSRYSTRLLTMLQSPHSSSRIQWISKTCWQHYNRELSFLGSTFCQQRKRASFLNSHVILQIDSWEERRPFSLYWPICKNHDHKVHNFLCNLSPALHQLGGNTTKPRTQQPLKIDCFGSGIEKGWSGSASLQWIDLIVCFKALHTICNQISVSNEHFLISSLSLLVLAFNWFKLSYTWKLTM